MWWPMQDWTGAQGQASLMQCGGMELLRFG
jgi:hypothetical protein